MDNIESNELKDYIFEIVAKYGQPVEITINKDGITHAFRFDVDRTTKHWIVKDE